ncbi:hypothetical protein AALO_G00302690 [Alosa alosa]|uniref:Uncharacterized protein n=1 Tax=Alosa alosa TaxID=278164 RepID=A0AAV6FLU1_9TELE|nr:hypothetical protein AALO_G00302690 [Alosa alosa]
MCRLPTRDTLPLYPVPSGSCWIFSFSYSRTGFSSRLDGCQLILCGTTLNVGETAQGRVTEAPKGAETGPSGTVKLNMSGPERSEQGQMPPLAVT